MESGESNSPPTEPDGATIAAWRQIYQLAKIGAPGFELSQLPPEYLQLLEKESQDE